MFVNVKALKENLKSYREVSKRCYLLNKLFNYLTIRTVYSLFRLLSFSNTFAKVLKRD